jgi:hypothetical protein
MEYVPQLLQHYTEVVEYIPKFFINNAEVGGFTP